MKLQTVGVPRAFYLLEHFDVDYIPSPELTYTRMFSKRFARHRFWRAVRWIAAVVPVLLATSVCLSQQRPASPAAPVDFTTQIQPILATACYGCHSGNEPRAQLHLDSGSLALKGGASGPVILPGDSRNSRLLHRVRGEDGKPRMPLAGTPLPADQITLLERWIDEGAKWPDSVQASLHWAYVKPLRPALPPVKNAFWVRNGIDRFVLARLEKEGLRPSPEASKETLIRRLSLDLTGLPPSVADIDQFLKDTRPDAYERLVDRLLASPHYGERWARPWLDLARYADSNGYEKDRLRSIWPYRDWVIKALNQNTRFNEFVLEQVAGDLLPNATADQKVATGFLRNSMTNQEAGVDPEESNWNEQVDRATAIGTAILGSTIGCAECHNHKFDPFTQKQFFQMVAFFNNAAFGKARGRGEGRSFTEAILDLPTPDQARQRDEIQAEIKQYESRLNDSSGVFSKRLAEWERQVKDFDKGWQPLRAARVSAQNGSILRVNDDNSISASGPDADIETYVIETRVPAGQITTLRIEALPDPSLPRSGPGRDYYGNFVVHHVDVDVVAGNQRGTKIIFSEQLRDDPPPTNNHPYAGGPPIWAVDASRDTVRLPRQLLLIPEHPFSSDGTSVFRFSILQSTGIPGQSLGRFRLSATTAADPKYFANLPFRLRNVLTLSEEKRTEQQQAQLANYYRSIATELAPLRQKLDQLDKRIEALHIPTTLIMAEDPGVTRPSTYIRMSGSFVSKGESVQADVPEFLGKLPADAPPNRLGLAKWLVGLDNPLTARVAVNHIWETYFGRGIVETAEDFGTQGSRPSHPELLDWLATEFMDSGWDLKALHRRIVSSSTYRQSSELTPELLDRDPNNVLLGRGPRFRVEAEMVRDIALATSGLLSAKVGGPSVMPYQPDGVWDLPLGGNADKWLQSAGEDRYRRGLYTVIRRTAPYPSMTVFDAPSREFCTARRARTDTPLQALTTLNDPVFVEAAHALAERIMREGGSSLTSRATYAFRLATSRKPQGQQVDVLLSGYAKDLAYFARHSEEAKAVSGKADAESAAWTMLARALLNLDVTLTKD